MQGQPMGAPPPAAMAQPGEPEPRAERIPRFQEGKLFLGGLDESISKAELDAYCSQWGEVADSVVMEAKNYGFVTFKQPPDAMRFLEQRDHAICGRRVDAKAAVPKNLGGNTRLTKKLFVGGTKNLRTEDFVEHFAQFGKIEDAVIVHREGVSRGFGFVTYDDEMSVEKCLVVSHVIAGKKVELKRAIPKEEMEAAEAAAAMAAGGGGGAYGPMGPGGGPHGGAVAYSPTAGFFHPAAAGVGGYSPHAMGPGGYSPVGMGVPQFAGSPGAARPMAAGSPGGGGGGGGDAYAAAAAAAAAAGYGSWGYYPYGYHPAYGAYAVPMPYGMPGFLPAAGWQQPHPQQHQPPPGRGGRGPGAGGGAPPSPGVAQVQQAMGQMRMGPGQPQQQAPRAQQQQQQHQHQHQHQHQQQQQQQQRRSRVGVFEVSDESDAAPHTSEEEAADEQPRDQKHRGSSAAPAPAVAGAGVHKAPVDAAALRGGAAPRPLSGGPAAAAVVAAAAVAAAPAGGEDAAAAQ
ncbi:hypothetical protein Rsub_08176 [Raphidocelis subcapitata]|uniref:RRM domain-containing protein n=1 Tax=Raphidocelis subcapitata TaxID=307507 RepID=A0A2V0PAK1_9CHLO|nr:hypothetical protein Rsub_08176 [Raphidocelis subcapitata]|eukprot:GBF94933.1 hypothetical protein Rsub_08176 [Raphidocelis subcapitata]